MNSKNTRLFYIDVNSPLSSEPNHRGSPERNLLMAMLERAILDYVGNNEADMHEADQWIFKAEANHHNLPFSFNWVCSELDLDPKSIADIIKDMPKRGHHRVAPWYFMKHENYQAA